MPLYSFCYFVGRLILGGNDQHPDFTLVHGVEGFLALGPRFFVTTLVGTTLNGLIGAVVINVSPERLLAALRRWHQRRSGGLSDIGNAALSREGRVEGLRE